MDIFKAFVLGTNVGGLVAKALYCQSNVGSYVSHPHIKWLRTAAWPCRQYYVMLNIKSQKQERRDSSLFSTVFGERTQYRRAKYVFGSRVRQKIERLKIVYYGGYIQNATSPLCSKWKKIQPQNLTFSQPTF